MEAVYSLDRCAAVRKSHENPAIVDIYDKYLGPGFGSDLAVETLHVEHPPPPSQAADSDESNQPSPPVFPPPLPPSPSPPLPEEAAPPPDDQRADEKDAGREETAAVSDEMSEKNKVGEDQDPTRVNLSRCECHVCGMQFDDDGDDDGAANA